MGFKSGLDAIITSQWGDVVKFTELIRLLEANSFQPHRQKGSIRNYAKPGRPNIVRIDYHGEKEVLTGTCRSIIKAAGITRPQELQTMIDLPFSLVIEATAKPDFFGFYSPELEGFSGVGHSVEDCLFKARCGMKEHVEVLQEQKLPVPPRNPNATILIKNEAQPSVA
jgi:predicted RNA binding protein YcfA (HicA-like mRNA interferase family)/predicted RNase H-like HicB family nuclease